MRRFFRFVLTVVRETVWIGVAVACLFGGYKGFQYLRDNRTIVEVAPVERPVTLVETMELVEFDAPLPIRTQGFIQPNRVVQLSSPSGGRISWLHPSIIELGLFEKGEVLVQFDDAFERAALSRASAEIDVVQTRLELTQTQLERTRALRQSGNATQQALDQLLAQEAELVANLKALDAALQSAEIAVANKQVTAPFAGAVLSKDQEIGSVVGGGQSIGRIFTQDRMEVMVPVREAEAAIVPGLFEGAAAQAKVEVDFGGKIFVWDASVVRVDPEFDSKTRNLRLSVALDDVSAPEIRGGAGIISGAPPALINSFAKVVIEGLTREAIFEVPTTSLRNGEDLWFWKPTDGDLGELVLQSAQPIHIDGESTFVLVPDLQDGQRLITTSLSVATPGMPLRDITASDLAALETE